MTRLLITLPMLPFTLLALVGITPSFAQSDTNYPEKPVRIVVPFPAGVT